MEHKFFSAQSFTSTQITWNDNVLGICQCGIKTTVSNAFFELARSFPPGVNVEWSTSFSVLKVSLPLRSRGTIMF